MISSFIGVAFLHHGQIQMLAIHPLCNKKNFEVRLHDFEDLDVGGRL
jgi:hypothetical protein